MITSLDTKIYDLSGQMNAEVLDTVDIMNPNLKLKVYIPKIMPNIQKGDPTIKKVQTKGYSVFKNANRVPVMTNQILQEKNYLETNLNALSNIDDIGVTSNKIIDEFNSSIKELAIINKLQSVERVKKLAYIVKKSNILRVEFLNCKLNKLAFTIMDRTKTDKELR